ncbi:unnamed protein product [Rhizophagus irregularis]|nr:unnamed protein product [Rhizophagus irregularis]
MTRQEESTSFNNNYESDFTSFVPQKRRRQDQFRELDPSTNNLLTNLPTNLLANFLIMIILKWTIDGSDGLMVVVYFVFYLPISH